MCGSIVDFKLKEARKVSRFSESIQSGHLEPWLIS